MPRPMYFASFAKKVFLRAGRIDGTVTSQGRRCARRVCGAQLVLCQRPHHGALCEAGPLGAPPLSPPLRDARTARLRRSRTASGVKHRTS